MSHPGRGDRGRKATLPADSAHLPDNLPRAQSPMILETSVQARFLIPMAISLGFGVLFATWRDSLVMVPCMYLVLDDLGALFGRNPDSTGLRAAR